MPAVPEQRMTPYEAKNRADEGMKDYY